MNIEHLLEACVSSGLFLVFEGIEGSGKTLQLDFLARHLRGKGVDFLVTREPGGTSLGRGIRRLLLEDGDPCSMAELFLYLADRAQHVTQVVRPALEAGRTVLSDRYYPSTLAYQGYGRGLDVHFVREASFQATGGLRPHLVVLLDLPVEEAMTRIRGRNLDRMERETLEFHAGVREGFLVQAREEPELFLVIDGTRRPKEVFQDVLAGLALRFPDLSHLFLKG